MATNDVPGANPVNGDSLHVGCWAEHADGSLMLVEGAENSRVVFTMFDMAKDPIVEYRDAMPEATFKTTFSWKPGQKGEKWLWHDKTAFPWDKVIKHGAQAGTKYASAYDQLTAAERVARSLALDGKDFKPEDNAHRTDQEVGLNKVIRVIRDALDQLAR